MKHFLLSLLLIFGTALHANVVERYYFTTSAKSSLKSETPHELIIVTADQTTGLMEPTKRKISFRIPLTAFNGFNSKQQNELFFQKLMETQKFPDVTFTGKLPADFSEIKSGMQTVYVTGMLTLHGIQRERTIQLHLFMADQLLVARMNIGIQLKDHSIEIPRDLTKQFASEIKIEVNAMMRMKLGNDDPSGLLNN